MTTHDNNVREAQAQLASRVDDMRAMLSIAQDGGAYTEHAREWLVDEGIDPEDATDEIHELVDGYGLSWERDSASFRDETVTYAHVLSTGGPHEEFRVTFVRDGHYGYSVESVVFVSLPWFDRVEIPLGHGPGGDEFNDVVRAFYETFYADLIHDENLGLFS